MLQPPIHYVPSYYGDLRVLRLTDKTCQLLVEQATADETLALQRLHKTALAAGWIPSSSEAFGVLTALQAPLSQVANVLAKTLKPNRDLLSVVRFSDGGMAELPAAPTQTPEPPAGTETPADPTSGASTPTTRMASPSSEEDKPEEKLAKKPKAAVTVAAPTRGCDVPVFTPAQLRAREALCAFLTPAQVEDFIRYQAFMVTGGMTGHRYLVTSRHERTVERGQLFDLEEQRALCVHDWDIPAEEEMLAIALFVTLPGREHYVRTLPGGH